MLYYNFFPVSLGHKDIIFLTQIPKNSSELAPINMEIIQCHNISNHALEVNRGKEK